MTYIVGWKFHNGAVIVSDSRISGSVNHNYALKTGILFPGCIVGMSGNVRAGSNFLKTVKKYVSPTNSVEENWSLFMKIAAAYAYPHGSDREFKLLIATRALGAPTLWIVDSKIGLDWIPEDRNPATLGSGKEILDGYVEEWARSMRTSRTKLPNEEKPKIPVPYMLCLALFAKSQSIERTVLERHHVGGVFHFIAQTNEIDIWQAPSLYALADHVENKQNMVWWMTRLVYIESGLLVESMTPPGQVRSDDSGQIDTNFLRNSTFGSPPQDLGTTKWKERIFRSSQDLPFYNFCGIAALDPDRRSRYVAYWRNSDQARYIPIDRNGRIHTEAVEDIYKYLFP